MVSIELRLSLPTPELLDASEDVQRVVADDGELCPALRDVLLALDDAITEALWHGGSRATATA